MGVSEEAAAAGCWRRCSRWVAAVLVVSLTVIGPARAEGLTGCSFGPDAAGDAAAPHATFGPLDLTSVGTLDTFVGTDGRARVRATIDVANLSATPADNIPTGASGITWELHMEGIYSRPNGGAVSSFAVRAHVDRIAGLTFDSGYVEASAFLGGQQEQGAKLIAGRLIPGTPGHVVIESSTDFTYGNRFGTTLGDTVSFTRVDQVPGAASSQAVSATTDRAPDAGYPADRYIYSPDVHTCVDTATWPAQAAAIPADAFVDSIGVGVPLDDAPSNTNSPDGTATKGMAYPKVRDALADARIRYIRDFVNQDPAKVGAKYLFDEIGVKIDLATCGRAIADIIATARRLGPAVVSVENTNEPEGATCALSYPAGTRTDQATLYDAMKADPATAHVQVLSPPCANIDCPGVIGDLTAKVDGGNLHAYPLSEPFVRGGFLDQKIDTGRLMFGDKPITVSETGWATPKLAGSPGAYNFYFDVSERAQGSYVPKTLLTNLASGISRTYLLYLVDAEPFIPGDLGGFGILRSDFTPKPAYAAVRNLNTLLADPGAAFLPSALSYSVTGENLRHVLMQKRDGSFWLALWQDARLYTSELAGKDRLGFGDLHPPSVPATLTFGSAQDATTYVPTQSTATLSTATGVTSMAVSVPSDDVLLYRLTPSVGETPPVVPEGPTVLLALAALGAGVGAVAVRRRRETKEPE